MAACGHLGGERGAASCDVIASCRLHWWANNRYHWRRNDLKSVGAQKFRLTPSARYFFKYSLQKLLTIGKNINVYHHTFTQYWCLAITRWLKMFNLSALVQKQYKQDCFRAGGARNLLLSFSLNAKLALLGHSERINIFWSAKKWGGLAPTLRKVWGL